MKTRNNKLLKFSSLILIYATIFFFILFKLPKFVYAEDKDKDKKTEVNVDINKEDKKPEVNIEVNKDGDTKLNISIEFDEENKPEVNVEVNKEDKDKEDEDLNKDVKENKKPQPKMEYNFIEPDIVYFDASKSFDTDGSIVSYSWDFGDGSTGSSVTATHTYSTPGKYRAILTVTDDGGLKNTCDKNVNIKSTDDSKSEEDNIIEDTEDSEEIKEENEDNVDDEENKEEKDLQINNINSKYIEYISKYISGYILENNNILQNKKEKQIEDSAKSNNNSVKSNDKQTRLEKESNKFIFKINNLLEKLLNIRKDKITKKLDININSIEELLNIERLIQRYNIVAVIDLDEIIDLNYENDIYAVRKNTKTKNIPEYLQNLWNKFKELAAFYN